MDTSRYSKSHTNSTKYGKSDYYTNNLAFDPLDLENNDFGDMDFGDSL